MAATTNPFVQTLEPGQLSLVGVNIAGASFGEISVITTGTLNQDYSYPTHANIDYVASKGMDVIRMDLKWERMQPQLFGDLREADMKAIDDVVSYAASKNIVVDISPHNYGKFFNDFIGEAHVPTAAFADLWGKLAARYADSPNVIFGLMNEPYHQTSEEWLDIANEGIKAIRAAGATQQILVPGTGWDGAQNWVWSDNDTVVGAGVKDPLGNYAFEVHLYLDDTTGQNAWVESETIGVERLQAVTKWAEDTGNKLFLGETAVGSDPMALKALDNMFAYMEEHSDVWEGATYWAMGDRWSSTFAFSVQPLDGQDRPQMDILEKYVSPPVPADPVHCVYELDERAAQITRLYDTALDRAPDDAGIKYYVDILGSGASTLLDLTRNFTSSPEFQGLYGTNPGNTEFVELLYHNALDRGAEGFEIAYYVDQLDAGQLSRNQAVINFSESPEHIDMIGQHVVSASQWHILAG